MLLPIQTVIDRHCNSTSGSNTSSSTTLSNIAVESIVAVQDGVDFTLGRVKSLPRVLDSTLADADTTQQFDIGAQVLDVRLLTPLGDHYVEYSSTNTPISCADVIAVVTLQEVNSSDESQSEGHLRRSARVKAAQFGLTRWQLSASEHERVIARITR